MSCVIKVIIDLIFAKQRYLKSSQNQFVGAVLFWLAIIKAVKFLKSVANLSTRQAQMTSITAEPRFYF